MKRGEYSSTIFGQINPRKTRLEHDRWNKKSSPSLSSSERIDIRHRAAKVPVEQEQREQRGQPVLPVRGTATSVANQISPFLEKRTWRSSSNLPEKSERSPVLFSPGNRGKNGRRTREIPRLVIAGNRVELDSTKVRDFRAFAERSVRIGSPIVAENFRTLGERAFWRWNSPGTEGHADGQRNRIFGELAEAAADNAAGILKTGPREPSRSDSDRS
ncbi:hypothetical protein K0M31_010330 [Melipona bicolor]|uniref:Uncharacterized protein n=1 Tax=Melipona bicolor TaxID=60889 RepID=A0AA40FLX9_9HYME|nr:hypothetical protein K0M31_010330 [Melipona bicolor]